MKRPSLEGLLLDLIIVLALGLCLIVCYLNFCTSRVADQVI